MEWLFESNYWFSRLIIQRGLGIIYLIAFLVSLNQFIPLLGKKGLLPVPDFLEDLPFSRAPSLFQWHYSDRLLKLVSYTGVTLSFLVILGLSESGPLWISLLIWSILWFLYLSIVNVGQVFYAYGWESLLLEAGFYAIFLGPAYYHTPFLSILLFRWLVFRVEFGAGLIKMRGDDCWKDLTCLNYHHETQPIPNPLSRFFHFLPGSFHKMETLFNHIVQLIAVWLLFMPQPLATIGALFIIISQLYLILSGNYAWLNWLTFLIAFSGISDTYLGDYIPAEKPEELFITPAYFKIILVIFSIVIIYLSIKPIRNMLSPNQRMNASFNPWHLVNSYGAFGSVTRYRSELIVEGTEDTILDEDTTWKAYKFKGKPNNINNIPPQVAPYHLRLDWQMWFAALSSIEMNPWLIKFVTKLLQNDPQTVKLLKENPFTQKPPNYIRIRLFEYKFEDITKTPLSCWWSRNYKHIYLQPQSLEQLNQEQF